jgi:DNA-binding transcriptional ArsR family regulator
LKEGRNNGGDRLVQALSHPRRLQLLAALERREATASVLKGGLEEEVGLNSVVYHLSVLQEAGCLELVESKPNGGTIERTYRANPNVFLDPVYRTHAGTAVAGEGLALNWSEVEVDDVGFDQVIDLLQAVRAQLLEVEEQSKQRLSLAGQDGVSLTVGVAALKPAPRASEARR